MPLLCKPIRPLAALTLGCLALLACAGELRREAFASPALGRDGHYTVYLPDGHDAAAAPLPVVYLLHGSGGDEWDWARQGKAVATLDDLIARGVLRPSVVVMPSLGPVSWWVNSAAQSSEDAVMRDLLPHIERRFKVRTDRAGRAIGGLSMGGFGALHLALRHPQRFCGAALISPAVYDPLPPEGSSARKAPHFQRNGAFDADSWHRLNHPAQLAAYQAAPQKVPMWIVSGDHDGLGIALYAAQLYWRLHALQPRQVELRIVDGAHDWAVFGPALPEALQYIDRQCRQAG